MMLTFAKIHWGDEASGVVDARVWAYESGSVAVGGTVTAISYRASKAGRFDTYRHAFTRQPRLMIAGDETRVPSARSTPKQMIALGWLVDLELQDGRRVHSPGQLVVTDEKGSSVWLAAVGSQPWLALEQLKKGPIVSEHGIEY